MASGRRAILPLRVIAVFESVALFSCGAMINKNASRCETYRRFLKRLDVLLMDWKCSWRQVPIG